MILAAGAAFLGNLILIPLILRFVRWRRWYDPTDHRKSHDGDISAMGGIGIFFSVLLAAMTTFLVFGVSLGNGSRWSYAALAAGATIMHLSGVIDDLVNLRALRKLVLQVVASAVAIAGGWVIPGVACPITGIELAFGAFAVPATLFWIVGISNAMNLIDGIDGSAAVIALCASLSFAALALFGGADSAAIVALALAGATAAFLVFNAPPARIFMGDGGSLFVGFSLALLAIGVPVSETRMVSIAVPVVLLAVPILDTAVAIGRRLMRRLPIHTPDREHLHHKLLATTRCGRRSLIVLAGLNVLLAIAATSYGVASGVWAVLLVLTALAAAGITYAHVHHLWSARAADSSRENQKLQSASVGSGKCATFR
ncbi:MAG: undecaprenyl/decaprenyl-phosphate alpha-N-acetylglucosaminyl 1-phosphate transferase [Spirochaetaceae bacterium]|nr:MAG: undecaprenyl/decaprenyl-phosphate alpha-N-acetylglucosaminyl 1-phosphate transferase [Spirochaetaceae bacterium]